MALAVGTRLGPYEILGRIGQGGMGVVYKVRDHKHNVAVALKTLNQVHPHALSRFKNEFRTMVDVAHPNLVTLHQLSSVDELWFFTMELVDGIDISSFIRKHDGRHHFSSSEATLLPEGSADTLTMLYSSLKDGEAGMRVGQTQTVHGPMDGLTSAQYERLRDTFRQLADGIGALHEAGILHRDIKPSNVLVTREGRVVLLDFGLATEMAPDDGQVTVHIAGTPVYMSPEQTEGGQLSPAADWFSVGVMLYEVLTGVKPFTGSLVEMTGLKRKGQYRPPNLVPGIPDDLSRLCMELLDPDRSLRPDGKRVLVALGEPSVARPLANRSAGATRFFGRDAHLNELRSAVERTRQGSAVKVFIRGQSGTGKTALIRHFLGELRENERDLVVLSGRCYEKESVPYKALDNLVDLLTKYLKRLPSSEAEGLLPRDLHALARLFPVLQEAEIVATTRRRHVEIPDSQELRRRAFAALRELLGRLAERKLLVLFIDDLQWGDADSSALLVDLLRPPGAPPLMLVATYRSGEEDNNPALRQLLDAPQFADRVNLTVAELTPAEARELALSLLGHQEPGARAQSELLALESAGNPFFLRELARSIESAQGASTLDELLYARVSELPPPARRFLEAVAVAGQPLSVEVACLAAGLGPEELSVVAQLRAAHLVRRRGNPEEEVIESYHDRVREAVVAHLLPNTLRGWHLALGRVLDESGRADPERLTTHFQGAGENEKAARYAAQAGARAFEALAFARAAQFYALALELWPPSDAEGRRLRTALGDALANDGRGAQAAAEYLEAARTAPTPEALELRRRAAERLLFSGHIDQGLEIVREVLAMVGLRLASTPRRALFSILWRRTFLAIRGMKYKERDASQIDAADLARIDICWSVASGLGLVDLMRGAEMQTRHLTYALKAGECYRVARALSAEVSFVSAGGADAKARKMAAQAQVLVDRIDEPYTTGLLQMHSGVMTDSLGRFRESAGLCERAEEIFSEKCTGVAWELDIARIHRFDALYWLGDWARMARELPAAIAEAQRRGDLFFGNYVRRLHMLYLVKDEPERAREEVSRALVAWSPRGFHLQHYWSWFAQVEIDLYLGDGEAAWRRLEETWPILGGSMLQTARYVLIESHHLRARVALAKAAQESHLPEGHARRFLKIAEDSVQRIDRTKTSWGGAAAALLRAGIASIRNQPVSAGMLAMAERLLEADGMEAYQAASVYRQEEQDRLSGRRAAQRARLWMDAQGVRSISRMCGLLAPGLWKNP
jgi:eukaryotic-like serine/threonine-protein kinase